MPLNLTEVHKQIQDLAEGIPERQEKLRSLLDIANGLLDKHADKGEHLRDKVARASKLNKYFRSAIPTNELLNETFPLPEKPPNITVIAADGSQINPDKHMGIDYCLVNVGAIQMLLDGPEAPLISTQTQLFYGDTVFNMPDKVVALLRDTRERQVLATLANNVHGPLITLTDGPIELWGKEVAMAAEEEKAEENYFEQHLKALNNLYMQKAVTAGYVVKPLSDLLIRLLEIASDKEDLEKASKDHRLRGVLDTELLKQKLEPGARSAIFGLQSRSSQRYQDQFSLHFFYLNVSLDKKNKEIARIEIPAWVAQNRQMVDSLHAVLVQQCQVVPARRYPYLLMRADETAVVTRKDKERVNNMIAQEFYRLGQTVPGKSQKQQSKDAARKKPLRKKGI